MPTWSGSERIRAREWRQAGMDKQVRPRRRRRSSAQLAAGGLPGLAPPGCSNKTPGLCFWAAPSGLGMSAGGRGTWRHKADATCMQMHAGRPAKARRPQKQRSAPAGSLWMDVVSGRAAGHHPPPFPLILPPASSAPRLAHTDTSHGIAVRSRLQALALAGSQLGPSSPSMSAPWMGTRGNRHGFGERKGRRCWRLAGRTTR
jgi:hypothetical protein